MKKLVLFAALVAVVSFASCKKAEAPVEAEEVVVEEVVVEEAPVAVDSAVVVETPAQ
ncbi:MAG: hypothetical protein LBN93_01980 [Candidatus Symbiothrix sp.]|jgi:hypothetical protein|nr:hypothetical protein [Candidatus Symbiothrix sp.]